MGAEESIRSTLNGNQKPEEALEEDRYSTENTYSSEDARYHSGLAAGAIIGALGYGAQHSISSGNYLIGLTSAGTAAMFAKFGGGLALRSYLKLGGKGLMKGIEKISSDEEEEHPFEAAKRKSNRN